MIMMMMVMMMMMTTMTTLKIEITKKKGKRIIRTVFVGRRNISGLCLKQYGKRN